MIKKHKLIGFAAVAAFFLLLSCKNNLSPEIPVEDIIISSNDEGEISGGISIVKGMPKKITVRIIPENATNKTLAYSSVNGHIASIDGTGLITAKGVGNAVIKITAANGVQKTINVIVTANPIPVTNIVFEGTTPASLIIGKSYRIMAKVQPDDATNKGLTYTADNNSAHVASDGTVTAQSEGTVTITVKSQSNPAITETVTITIKQRPSIELITEEMTSESGESNLNLEIKTLNGKLSYTPKIVGEESGWLTVVRVDNTTSTEKDTIYLKAAQNKTVWKRTAYINFEDGSNQVIKNAAGKKLEVKVVQKENEHPNVTIKWVYGIGEPTQTEKEKIETPLPGQTKKFYWDDNKIFYWYESNNTKWFNNRKLYPLNLTDPVYSDSAQCWGKTASNMLHWWFIQNKENIDRYIEKKNITGEEKNKYQDFYTRGIPDNKEKEKSYIAKTFRVKAHNSKLGDYIIGGLSWYLYGNKAGKISKPGKDDPALFKDVFDKSESKTPIKAEGIYNKADFNRVIAEALDSKKAIGINIEGSKGEGLAYGHAITLWGAGFDEEGNILIIYVVNNNFKENRIYPYGIYYKDGEDGRPYLFNYPNNVADKHKYVGQVTTLDKGEELWKEWLDKNK